MGMIGRKDWVQADLRCLMCGRVAGHLIGPLPADGNVQATNMPAGHPPRFAVFRPADAAAPAVRLFGGERFRCTTCGGALMMDEPERFSTYEDVGDELEQRPRRGRPPKPWRATASAPEWLTRLGLAGGSAPA